MPTELSGGCTWTPLRTEALLWLVVQGAGSPLTQSFTCWLERGWRAYPSLESQFLKQWLQIIVCRESLWHGAPKSSHSICFSIKASGVLRSGSGPRKYHVASSLILSFNILQTEHKSSSKNAPVWKKQPSQAPADLHSPQWFGPHLCLRWDTCNRCAEVKLCIRVPELTVTFKIVLKKHMYIDIYKQQHCAENIL